MWKIRRIYLLIRQPRRRSDFPYSKYRQRRMRRQTTVRFTSFTNMAAEDLRVSQISIRGEFVRMKRELTVRNFTRANAISRKEGGGGGKRRIFVKLNARRDTSLSSFNLYRDGEESMQTIYNMCSEWILDHIFIVFFFFLFWHAYAHYNDEKRLYRAINPST